MKRFASVATFGLLGATLLLAGCGGGSTTIPVSASATSSVSQSTPGTTPSTVNLISAASDGRSTEGIANAAVTLKCNYGAPLHGPCAENAAIPATGGYSGTMLLPSGTGVVTIATSTASLTYAPALHAVPLVYITVTARNAVVLNGIPGFTLSVPGSISGVLSIADRGSFPWTKVEGPARAANGQVAFAPVPGSIALAAGQSVTFALYASAPTPTPVHSAAPNPTPVRTAAPKPTPTPNTTTVQGTVVQIPVDGYGPYAYMGSTYASTDSAVTTPLSGATVVIGPTPALGASLGSTIPAGDVVTTTNAAGAFSVAVPGTPVMQSGFAPIVSPGDNVTTYVGPNTGFYISVYGAGSDGLSAGKAIPLHAFRAIGTPLALRVSTTSASEAAALAALNSDRAANGVGALTFDESAEEAARLHATDEVARGYYCHYDTKNAGPASRYMNAGGLGQTNENLSTYVNTSAVTPSQMFPNAEASFMAEKATRGGHYVNNVDPAHVWAGLAAVSNGGAVQATDYELVDPDGIDDALAPSGYPVETGCPAGTVLLYS